jgi:hypothetical protein
MTGVIMAGRTGAAFAAELGTIAVNEEIDALQTLGIPPMNFWYAPDAGFNAHDAAFVSLCRPHGLLGVDCRGGHAGLISWNMSMNLGQ